MTKPKVQPATDRTSLAKIAEGYIAERPKLSSSTKRKIAHTVRAIEACHGSTVYVDMLDEPLLAKWIAYEQAAGMGDGTVRVLRSCLFALWGMAWRLRLTDRKASESVNWIERDGVRSVHFGRLPEDALPDTATPRTNAAPDASRGMPIRELFRQYLLERDVSQSHRKQVEYSIGWLERWHGSTVFVGDINDDFANRWLWHEQERTVGMSLWTLKNRRRHRYAALAIRRVRKISAPRSIPRAWTQDEMRRLIDETKHLRKTCRICKVARRLVFRALLLTAWDTGLRPVDLKALRFKEIGPDGTFAIVQHKTNWPIHCALKPETMQAIVDSYAESREFIFPGNHRRWCEQMRRLTKAAGLVGTFKTIRKSSATAVESIQSGAGMAHLGHKTHGLAEQHYLDPRLIQQKKVQTPSLYSVPAPCERPKQTGGDILAWL